MGAPTPKEIQLLPKFRDMLVDIKSELEGYRNEDHYLLRWIRARDWELPKAEEMLRKHLKWRKEFDIDALIQEDFPLDIVKNYPYELWGRDKDDSPCGILLFGVWNIKEAVDKGQKLYVQRYFEKCFEELEEMTRDLTKKLGKPITQLNFIVDMDRLSYRQLISIPTVETILGLAASFESNRAESVKSCIIINAPKVFNILFSLVKPFLSPRTIAKIEIFTHDDKEWKPRLLRVISPDQIPVRYGGTNETFMDKFKSLNLDDIPSPTEDFVSINIDAGEKVNIEYDLNDPTINMTWAFNTEAFDIGFSISVDGEVVQPYERYESDQIIKTGTIKCSKPGKYVVCFDNSYSRMRGKALKYLIEFSQDE